MNALIDPVRNVAEELGLRTLMATRMAARIMLRGTPEPAAAQTALELEPEPQTVFEGDFPHSSELNGVYTVALDHTNTIIDIVNDGPVTGAFDDRNHTVVISPTRAKDKSVIGLAA